MRSRGYVSFAVHFTWTEPSASSSAGWPSPKLRSRAGCRVTERDKAKANPWILSGSCLRCDRHRQETDGATAAMHDAAERAGVERELILVRAEARDRSEPEPVSAGVCASVNAGRIAAMATSASMIL